MGRCRCRRSSWWSRADTPACIWCRSPGSYQLIGRTRDDAAGEAFDKVARLLGLSYPGGPVIDRLARVGDDRAVEFPAARITHPDRNRPPTIGYPGTPGRVRRGMTDFSFSGIKTAVKRHVAARLEGLDVETLPAPEVADLCASFQRSVVGALLDRTFEAATWCGAKSIGIAGGVSANSRLRADAAARGAACGLPVFVPTLALSTDNAAMIAAAGFRQLERGRTGPWDLNADAALAL